MVLVTNFTWTIRKAFMRIDLHAHTQKCKKGDGAKRNIAPQAFVDKMSEQNVKVCAITNHNKFDEAEYKKIVELSPELTIFPGIELDIDFHDERRHIVLICNPKCINEFYSTFDNDTSRNYDTFSLSYEDFIAKVKSFGRENIIIIPHFMDKERGFTIGEKEELFKDLTDYIVILETSKLRSMGVVNDHAEHLSLIGSDVKDWDTYSKDALPEIKFHIDSFEKFFELASDAKGFVKNVLNGATRHTISIDNASVAVFEDINVVFGEKGSGKTILLKEHVYKYFCDIGKRVFLHEGKEYARLYEEMIKSHEESVEIDKDSYSATVDGFNNVINYNEQTTQNFIKSFIDYREDSSKNKKSKRILKISSTFSNNLAIPIESILNAADVRIKKIDEVITINSTVRKSPASQKDKEKLNEELNKLKVEIQKRVTTKHREIFIAEHTELFLSALKESLQKKAQRKPKPNNIGFSKLVSKRLHRLESNKLVLDSLNNVRTSQEINIGYLPVKGNVKFETSILTLTEEDRYKKDSVFDKARIIINRKLIEKIKDFSVEDFSDINQYFDSTEKEIVGEIFARDVIKKSSVIKIAENNDYSPSEGEKAILSISGLLESYSYDCYLFDEVENGLGNRYISDYLIPRLKDLRNKGKTIVLSTHNANIAVNTLPSQVIYCDYPSENNYYEGNMYSNELVGIVDSSSVKWEEKAIIHLEGNEKMFNKRKNIYGL